MIRLATNDDRAIVCRMGRVFWESTAYRSIPYCIDSAYLTMAQMISDGLLLVAEVDGQVVGMMGLAISPCYINRSESILTELFFYIEPAARRAGLAAQMIEQAKVIAQRVGSRFISLMSLDGESAAAVEKLYESAGLRIAERSYIQEIA